MAHVDVKELRYARDAIEVLQQLEREVYDRALKLAADRALAEGRVVVVRADVMACLREAFDRVAREQHITELAGCCPS